MDCRTNGEVIFTGATTEFQLRKGLTRKGRHRILSEAHHLSGNTLGEKSFLN